MVAGEDMRQPLLMLVAGALWAMPSLAAAQTLPGSALPMPNTEPGPILEPSPLPSVEGAAPAGMPMQALQAQLESQKKDIDSLIKAVGMLTEQVKQARAGEAGQAGTPEPAAARPPALGEDLRQAEQTLTALRREQAAAPPAPTPEQMQKQLELQGKMIEVLNRMIRLLVSQLEKQGPAVAKLQSQAATLQARSEQAAQRDQDLANGLDNVTESIDATRRSWPALPAPLKELFLPSGTNESPLSIYNALSMRYNDFVSTKGAGNFQFIEYDPIFLLKLNEKFLFEAQLEVHPDGVEPEFAQVDYIANDWLTIVGGRFMTPIGSFNDRLHYLWINKLPDFPIFAWAVVPFDFNLNGAMARGAHYLFDSPVKMEYAFYVANGLNIPGQGGVADFANIQGQTDASKSINNAIASGGRLGLWVPCVGFNGGISYFGSRPYTANVDGVAVDMWDIDLNYHRGNWDIRFEAAQTYQNTATLLGSNILLRGLYAQIAYRPYDISIPFLQKTEAVARYSTFRGSGYTPDQIDLTAFTFPNQAPISRNQYTFGVNYYPYPSMALRVALEINQEVRTNLKDNVFLAGFFWGF